MSRSAIRAALEGHLASLMPAWPTAWENVAYEPAIGTPWQRARVLFGRTTSLGFAADAGEEWSGIFHITVWTPAGHGPAAAEARAALLRGDRAASVQGHFRKGLSLSASGAIVTILQPTDGPVLDTDPAWYGLPGESHLEKLSSAAGRKGF